jgi:pyruvate kinase
MEQIDIHFQKTKTLATVGPACNDYNTLLELVKAGVDVFRLNFSHGSHEDHLKAINYIQYINKKFDLNVGILGDLQGPKLRIGEIENNHLPLAKGDVLTFVNERCVGNKNKIYMSYELFPQDVKEGEKVLLDDGKVVLQVLETNRKDTVKLQVLHGEVLSSKKGVNLPDTNVSLPSITEKDEADLEFMLRHPFNWIALSFVRHENDILDLRSRIKERQHRARIVAKIEKPEAIRNLDAIIRATDAVMIARGDLGIEMPMEDLPLLQKDIINRCIHSAKPVIVATQMMDSMIQNPSPTRAEVNDVANAVLDGADAVMLSGETSVGKHPVLVVEAMNRIIAKVENEGDIYLKGLVPLEGSKTFLSDALCYNACEIASEIRARAIVGMTKSGYTGFMLSCYRPKSDIFIFSADPDLLGALSLIWGVRGFAYDKFTTTDGTIQDVNDFLKNRGFVRSGDIVINTGSMPLHERRRTNMLKISVVD